MPGKCGGCAYRHLTYPEELWAKRQRVQDALTRIGGLDLRWRRSWGQRIRSTTATRASTPWGLTAPSASFRPGPIKVVPIRRCLIQTEAADRTAAGGGGVDAPLQDLRLR